MPSFSYFPRSPGLRVPFNNFNPYNIVTNRAPNANDLAELSTLWVQPFDNNGNPVNALWILTSIVAGQATWTSIEASGAGGVFSSLTVNPGPTSLTGVLTQTGTANINTSGAAVTSIGVGGTGAVNIGNATGGTTISAGNLTLTSGNVVVSNGNVSLLTAGRKFNIAPGANASIGTSAAMVAGTTTVSTTAVTASSLIFLSVNTPGGTQGVLSAPTASIVAGTSFVINSSNAADTSTVNWWIIN